jgi:hypothetical protein
MRAATVSEGWANTVEEADRMLADGTVTLEPGYRHDTVLPMASTIGPSCRYLSSTTPTVALGRRTDQPGARRDRLVRLKRRGDSAELTRCRGTDAAADRRVV